MSSGIVTLAGGGHLAYETRGDGPPLLLCRWMVGAMPLWHRFADALAQTHRVIAFDPRGTGASSDGPLRATTRDMAGDARALLDALAIDRADVFGESLGGMTASWLAIDAPTRVRRLVLSSTLPEPTTISSRAITHALGYARCFVGPIRDAVPRVVRKMSAPEFRATHPARMAAIEAALRRAPSTHRNLVAMALAALRHRAAHRLADVHAPTLLLFGADDPLVGSAARDELIAERPSATVVVLAEAGHALTLERPDEIAARVRDFLS